MSKYRILREDFFDEKGSSLKTCFFIQKQYKFLFFKWWRYIKHENVGIKSLKNIPLHFDGMMEAEKFINNILKKNKNYMGHHRYVLKIID